MGTKILLLVFYFGGAITIGTVFRMLSKSLTVYTHTTKDRDTARGIVICGCLATCVWLFFVGLFLAAKLLSE